MAPKASPTRSTLSSPNSSPMLTPSQIPAGQYVTAHCKDCGEHRYVTRALMLAKAGDVPLSRIEPRLRCIARPRSNKRGPACGGPMTLALDGPVTQAPEANAAYPHFEVGYGA